MAGDTIDSRLNPDGSTFISIFGKKGQGKSVLARRFWDTWPHDECCIDINADALDAGDVDQTFKGEVPDFWPAARREDEPVRIRYVPELRSSTYTDDLDRAVGLALKRPHSLLWVDEVGVLSRANRTGPHTRRLLHHGRHLKISSLMCGPRPIDIDPLVIAQSDHVYVFKLPNPADVKRVAAVCGIPPKELEAAVHALDDHEYLHYDGRDITHYPPLPLERAR
jgi:hypothetical protein